jgi:hypothetical protein
MLHPGKIACVLLAASTIVACGGDGKKKAVTKPIVKEDKPPPPPPETEEDREAKRKAAALAIVPDKTSCLPQALKESTAPRLELAAIGGDAMVCAVDHELDRLLGPVACWKVDLSSGGVDYKPAAPEPGRGFPVKIDEGCARRYCLPKDAKAPENNIAHIVWSPDSSKVAVVAGDDAHIFDAATKEHEKSFTIRGDKGVPNDPIGVTWVGTALFIEGADAKAFSAVWGFRAESGTPMGAIEGIGAKNAKPLSTHGGSFVVLDKGRVAISEQGLSTMTTYEVETGKRAKLVRKLAKSPCKVDEAAAFWADSGDGTASAKCKDHLTKEFAHLIGADAVAGKTSLLVLTRGPRLGELAVLDAKTLAEKKAIKLQWCEGDEGKAKKSEKLEQSEDADDAEDDAKPAKPTKRGAVPKPKGGGSKDEDPDAGGE